MRVFDKSEVNSWLEDSLVKKDLLAILESRRSRFSEKGKENEHHRDARGKEEEGAEAAEWRWSEELKCHVGGAERAQVLKAFIQ